MHALPIVMFVILFWKFPKTMGSLLAIVIGGFGLIMFINANNAGEFKDKRPDYPQSYYDKTGRPEKLDLCFVDPRKSKYPDPLNPECADWFKNHPEARPEVVEAPKTIVAPPRTVKKVRERTY